MQLHVRVIEALDIAKMDVGKSDPYCILSLSSGNDTRRTRVIDNTVTPKWNEDFHFNCPNPAMSALKILMKDKDVMSDDSMATLEVQLCSLQPGVVTDQWYNMTPCKGVKKGGRIHLILHIAPNGAQAFVNAPVGAPGMMPQAGYPQPYSQPGMMPPQGYPQGMPQQGMPSQGYPQGMPQQGYPQGMPQQGYPQAMPPQGYPQGMPQQGYPQGMPPQGYPQAMPPQGYPQGYPQGMPQQGYPQAMPQQGYPQGYPQGMPQQGYPQAGFPPRPPGMSDKDYKKMCKKQMKAMKKGHY